MFFNQFKCCLMFKVFVGRHSVDRCSKSSFKNPTCKSLPSNWHDVCIQFQFRQISMYIHIELPAKPFQEQIGYIYISVCLLLILFLVTSTQLLDAVIGMMSAFNFNLGTYLCIYTCNNAYIYIPIHTHM